MMTDDIDSVSNIAHILKGKHLILEVINSNGYKKRCDRSKFRLTIDFYKRKEQTI